VPGVLGERGFRRGEQEETPDDVHGGEHDGDRVAGSISFDDIRAALVAAER